MKPIHLTIAGLHSFREEQEIPFAQLSALGIFGIFGSTGSGKSSILDAMTLALYGTVVRAGRRTQGILNHAEKQVKVAFTFALGQGDERRLYRVERRYGRKDQVAVANSYSRLVLIADSQETILADKDREVTEQVTNLLGLREEDFTKAVVLPQGKFAEFLTLGGKERREMLQRLFSLEQYGNVLLHKINEQYHTVEIGYIEIESEQKGLGNAAAAAVMAAEAALTAARQAEAVAKQQYAAAEQHCRQANEVYSLQCELVQTEQERSLHRRQEVEMQALQAAVAAAERAGQVAAVLEEFLSSRQAEQTADAAKQQTQQLAAQLSADSKQLSEAHIAAQQNRLSQEPTLIERRTRLMAAKKLETEAAELAQEVAQLTKRQQAQELEWQTASKAAADRTVQSNQLTETVRQAELQLQSATVSLARRSQLQVLLSLAQAVSQNKQAAEKLKNAGIMRKQRYEAAQAAACQAAETLRQAEQELNEREAAAEQAVASELGEASARLERLLIGEKQAAAIRLAGELTDGCPCPVCGSRQHPQPAVSRSDSGGRTNNFEQEIAAAQEQIARLSSELAAAGKKTAAERQQLDGLRTAAAGLAQQAASALTELEKSREEYAELHTTVVSSSSQLLAALPATAGMTDLSAAAALSAVVQLQAEVEQQDKLAEGVSAQLVSYRQAQAACQEELALLQQRIQASSAELAGLTAGLHSSSSALAASQQELFLITQGIPVSSLQAQIARQLETLYQSERQAQTAYEQAAAALAEAERNQAAAESGWQAAVCQREKLQLRLTGKLEQAGFPSIEAVAAASLTTECQAEYRRLLSDYAETEQRLTALCDQLSGKLGGRQVTLAEWEQSQQAFADAEQQRSRAVERRVEVDKEYRDLAEKYQRWSELEARRLELKVRKDGLQTLKTLLRGNVFVEFLAQEQMAVVAWQASERLKEITQYRYALEMSADGGFLIRDDANGGVKRPVSTLSGGETFQASLALALALSAQIQLKGKYPLEFFFLDEGFGSLDQQALDMAMATLEKLHLEKLTIGIISHVAELRQRILRRLLVEPAEAAGRGSRVRIEEA